MGAPGQADKANRNYTAEQSRNSDADQYCEGNASNTVHGGVGGSLDMADKTANARNICGEQRQDQAAKHADERDGFPSKIDAAPEPRCGDRARGAANHLDE
jgi:hypothetical protein